MTKRPRQKSAVEDEYLREGKEKAESSGESDGSGSDEDEDEIGPHGSSERSKSEGYVSPSSLLRPNQDHRPDRYHGRPNLKLNTNAGRQSGSEEHNSGTSALSLIDKLSLGPTSDPRIPHRPQ